MANVLLTPAMITLEALMVLKNNLTFTRYVNRQYDKKFGIEGAKIGDTLNVRKPPRYRGRRGPALQVEDIIQTSVPVTLGTQYGVDMSFTSKDRALSIERFSQDIIGPAVAKIANDIDADGMLLYRSVWNQVGTPGTVPNAALTYLQAKTYLDNNACPMDGRRSMVISSNMESYIVDALKGLFQSASKIRDQYESGRMGTGLGFEFSMDQNVYSHTIGALGGTPLVNTNGQSGTSLLTRGWTNAAATRLNVGDVFTIANVYALNPMNYTSTGFLQQFTVTAPGVSDAGGLMTIQISPGITLTGPFANCSVAPTDGAALTIFGAANTVTPQGLGYHRDAFTFACSDLPLPKGVDMAERASDDDLGISIRLVSAYNIQTDQFATRLDVLGGWAPLRPELAVRVCS